MFTGPELVCRVVQLVASGALDDSDEYTVAARVGVSPRHLRRLFIEHVGVTPTQLAQSRRAHFARRLLDDTDLTIVDVAFASGFSSVRQFNRVLGDVFQETPTALRARRRASDRVVADGGLALRLRHPPEVDLSAVFRYLAERAVPHVEAATPSSYRRVIMVDGDPGAIEIRRLSADEALLVAHLPRLTGLAHHVSHIRLMLGLDGPHCRPSNAWDPTESAIRETVETTLPSRSAARQLLGTLTRQLGTPVPQFAHLGIDTAFPSASAIAAVNLRDLLHAHTAAESVG